jgi:ankyrin repeat protein
MQMNQCSQVEAVNFLSHVYRLVDVPLTSSAQTLLMVACSIGSLNIVKAILSYKPNVNIKDSIGRLALHYAAAIGSI